MNTATLEKPAVPTVSGKLSELIDALQFAHYAVSSDALRPWLKGVRLDIDTRGLHVWATCGHRMHYTLLPFAFSGCAAGQFLLKAEDVSQILKAYSTKRSQRGASFAVDYEARSMVLKSDLGERKYHHWPAHLLCSHDTVLPRNATVAASLYVDHVLPIVRAAALVSELAFQAVKFEAKAATAELTLSVTVKTFGNRRRGGYAELAMRTHLTDVCADRDIVTGYNAKYLRDALSAIGPNSPLRWRVGNPEGPAIFDGARDDQFVLIMPMQV